MINNMHAKFASSKAGAARLAFARIPLFLEVAFVQDANGSIWHADGNQLHRRKIPADPFAIGLTIGRTD